MRYLKHNWRTAGLQALLGSTAMAALLALVTMPHWMPPSAYAQEQEAAQRIDPAVYSGVQALRRELALTNIDLAASGVDRASAEAVLGDVLAWYEANQAALLERERAVLAAERELQETYRRIHVGPRDEQVLSSVGAREAGVAAARSSRDRLLSGLVDRLTARLSTDQQRVWAAARANRDRPASLRYASGLSDEQVAGYESAMRERRDGNAPSVSILTLGQHQEAAAARESRRLRMPAVLAAEQQVLPVPAELREVEVAAVE